MRHALYVAHAHGRTSSSLIAHTRRATASFAASLAGATGAQRSKYLPAVASGSGVATAYSDVSAESAADCVTIAQIGAIAAFAIRTGSG